MQHGKNTWMLHNEYSLCDSDAEKWYRSLTSNDPETGHVTCVVLDVSEAVFTKAVHGISVVEWKSAFELLEISSSAPLKRDKKSAISLQRSHFDPKFQVEGVAPPIVFHE